MIGAGVEIHREANEMRICISGEIDVANAVALEQQLTSAIDNDVTRAVVDLTETDYIDSAGIRVLFDIATRLRTRQIAIRVIAPLGSAARRALEISGYRTVASIDDGG